MARNMYIIPAEGLLIVTPLVHSVCWYSDPIITNILKKKWYFFLTMLKLNKKATL
jgi:hypothetical protein